MKNRHTCGLLLGMALMLLTITTVTAQITQPRKLSASIDRYANLKELLVNRLRAFDQEKQSYIEMVVEKVRLGQLDTKLVLAVERYAIARNAQFPFPFFERALRYQARKQGVQLPTVRQFVSTAKGRR